MVEGIAITYRETEKEFKKSTCFLKQLFKCVKIIFSLAGEQLTNISYILFFLPVRKLYEILQSTCTNEHLMKTW